MICQLGQIATNGHAILNTYNNLTLEIGHAICFA